MKHTLITLSALLLIGCGSRKSTVQKETVKEQTEQTATTETKTDTNETVKVVDTSTIDEIEFIPIDNTQPIIYNGQKVFNAKIRHSKRKNDITTVSSKKVAETRRNEVKTKVKREVKVKDKVTEAKRGFPWWILLVICALYLAYRKVKSMNVI
jgi:PBP1b-binding outer membrane lipoprotein LpoB